MTDYELEVSARKIGDDSKYFHLFVRTVVPTKDFYFVEVSYNSNTISIYEFNDGAGTEITPGGNAGRPKRPDSKDTKGGEHYLLTFSAEGNILKYSVDGRLSIVVQNDKWKTGPSGTRRTWWSSELLLGPCRFFAGAGTAEYPLHGQTVVSRKRGQTGDNVGKTETRLLRIKTIPKHNKGEASTDTSPFFCALAPNRFCRSGVSPSQDFGRKC